MDKPLQRTMKFQGLSIAIETDKGQFRFWYDANGKEKGKTKMLHPYGYVVGTLGTDGDEVDVYVGPCETSNRVFVITQLKAPGFQNIDEQKVMLGFNDPIGAKTAYLRHYNTARFFGTVQEMTMDEFRSKLKSLKGKLLKSSLINKRESAKMTGNNMLFLDLNKAGDFKPVALKPGSDTGSKTTYANKACSDKEEDDKAIKEMDNDIKKSLSAAQDVAKALKAAAVAGLGRRQRIAEAVASPTPTTANPLVVEPVSLAHEDLNIGMNKAHSRPFHEPPPVPVRKVETPRAIPPRECGDHAYKVKEVGPQEAGVFWRR